MENLITISVILLLAVLIPLFGYRYEIKWLIQKIYFGEDHLNHRKKIWFTEMSESYASREKYVKDFIHNYNLSENEVMHCFELLKDSNGLTEIHKMLFNRLVALNAVKKNRARILVIIEPMACSENWWIIRNYCFS